MLSVCIHLVEGVAEFAHFAIRKIPVPTILLLQPPGEIFAVAGGDVEHVIGKIALFRLGLAFQLFPGAEMMSLFIAN